VATTCFVPADSAAKHCHAMTSQFVAFVAWAASASSCLAPYLASSYSHLARNISDSRGVGSLIISTWQGRCEVEAVTCHLTASGSFPASALHISRIPRRKLRGHPRLGVASGKTGVKDLKTHIEILFLCVHDSEVYSGSSACMVV
jgi:hypothetical protein